MLENKVIVVWSAAPSYLVTTIRDALNARGARVVDVAGTMEDPADADVWNEQLQTVKNTKGRVDGLVVVSAVQPHPVSITSLTLEEFSTRLRALTLSAWVAQQQGVLTFRGQGTGGAIVHVTSASPTLAYSGDSPLAAASAGILMAARAGALECGKAADGTVINSVIAAGAVDENPGDVADAVAFLLGDGAGYMTGTELRVGADLS